MLAFNDLTPDPNNPRKEFDWITIAELGASMLEHGILEPLLVREFKPGAPKFGHCIVFGERRWRAVEWAVQTGDWDPDEKNIPCIVRAMTDEQALIAALVENIQRENMQPLDEAEAFAQLHRHDRKRYSTEKIATVIGRTPRYVQQRIALLKLDDADKASLRAGKLDVTTARDKVTRHSAPEPEPEQTDIEGETAPDVNERMIEIPLQVATVVRRAFLPLNPKGLRRLHEDSRWAAVQFIDILSRATRKEAAE